MSLTGPPSVWCVSTIYTVCVRVLYAAFRAPGVVQVISISDSSLRLCEQLHRRLESFMQLSLKVLELQAWHPSSQTIYPIDPPGCELLLCRQAFDIFILLLIFDYLYLKYLYLICCSATVTVRCIVRSACHWTRGSTSIPESASQHV